MIWDGSGLLLGLCDTVKFAIDLILSKYKASITNTNVPNADTYLLVKAANELPCRREKYFCISKQNNSRLRSAFSLPWSVTASVIFRTRRVSLKCCSRRCGVMWQQDKVAERGSRRSKVCNASCEGSGVCRDMSTLWWNGRMVCRILIPPCKYWSDTRTNASIGVTDICMDPPPLLVIYFVATKYKKH